MSDGKAKIEEVGHLSRLLAAHEDMAILEDFTAKKPSVRSTGSLLLMNFEMP